MLKNLNAAVRYIEENLCGKIDLAIAAKLACVSTNSFLRFFSYMTGMSPVEYIRRRRISDAAHDLRHSDARILDIAMKYGYDSADAFTKAFIKQHGISPSSYRKNGGTLRIYPPASFHIVIKGAKEMNFKITELPETELYGISKPFDGQGYETREELRHIMWAEDCENLPEKICGGRWNETGSTALDGVWYGVWQNGSYMIAREKSNIRNDSCKKCKITAGIYAVFTTEQGGLAWEELPKLFSLIFDSWLPASGYRLRTELAVEVLHLWTDGELRRKNRYYEIWIPVEPK